MENIIRPIYLNHIITLLDRGMMLFLVGQRRVGKSFILRQVRDWIAENIDNANVIYINKEDHIYADLLTAEHLTQYVDTKLVESARNYLLIDEVQDIESFENALRSYNSEDKCQIIATGSNAYVFSSELSTRLSGRYIEIPVYSLTYREFLTFNNLTDSDESLRKYLKVGGLPALCRFDIDDESQVREYIQGVYNTILIKDIIGRNKIRNVEFAQNLSAFVADNIGKPVSTLSIYKYLKAQGDKISEMAVSDYLRYLNKALLTCPVARYDIHGKKLFEQIFKYYFSDHGIRNFLTKFNIQDSIEKIMENVVWHYLVSQGFDVTVGILRAGEIDFVGVKGAQRIYVQVAYIIASEETKKREFGNLEKIADSYPKYVVTMDPFTGGFNAYNGIHHLHLREFLMTDL